MNEEQTKQVVEEEDFFNMDESDFADTPSEEEQIQNEENVEENTTPKTEPQKDETTDEQKLLSLLKSKVRYNGEEVDIKSMDDVVANYQKGLNYDNLKAKSEKSENAVMNYVMAKAKSMNMTPEQYIDKVKSYEEEQKKNAQEQEVQRMMDRGVDEETARRVARTEAYVDTLKAREEELNRQEEARKVEAQKDNNTDELAIAFTKDGKCLPPTPDKNDLFFASENQEGWMNIYRDSDGNRYVMDCPIFTSKEEAEKKGKRYIDYITTIKIEWEE